MKDRLPAIIACFILLGLIAITWWAADYADRAFPVEAQVAESREPDAWSGSFTMLQADADALPVTRLDGSEMRHYPHNGAYEISKPQLISQRPDSPRVIASSNTAWAYNNVSLIHMLGKGHVHRFPTADSKALDITSEKLIVHPDEDIIETDEPAIVIQGDSRLVGEGMKYNNNTRKLEVYANSGVRIAPKDMPNSNSNSN
ncbi:LPS export ABC transporter periplasmic protein LptC [Oligella urethralis]|uniref:LPS export ABC transporter periplasmic protein LptC n=1 Tax=Oligella urethralis TaxID=90245 RepID=UPI00065F9005|nr:LPS export ABC transporter periplasmic protein LptC [Oligella urethralis]